MSEPIYPPFLNDTFSRPLPADPIGLFMEWHEQAKDQADIRNPDAMCVSTIDKAGAPDARMVLLKGIDHRGFVFYTNIHSVKAKSLTKTPLAALTFYWEKLGKQVRVKGSVKQVSELEADAYFSTRPRPSRIGAWASEQSSVLEDPSVLEDRIVQIEEQFKDRDVPRPDFWSGYRIIPYTIEFWLERPHRLHERLVFERLGSNGDWSHHWLCP